MTFEQRHIEFLNTVINDVAHKRNELEAERDSWKKTALKSAEDYKNMREKLTDESNNHKKERDHFKQQCADLAHQNVTLIDERDRYRKAYSEKMIALMGMTHERDNLSRQIGELRQAELRRQCHIWRKAENQLLAESFGSMFSIEPLHNRIKQLEEEKENLAKSWAEARELIVTQEKEIKTTKRELAYFAQNRKDLTENCNFYSNKCDEYKSKNDRLIRLCEIFNIRHEE